VSTFKLDLVREDEISFELFICFKNVLEYYRLSFPYDASEFLLCGFGSSLFPTSEESGGDFPKGFSIKAFFRLLLVFGLFIKG
jgi:hypothetical protein